MITLLIFLSIFYLIIGFSIMIHLESKAEDYGRNAFEIISLNDLVSYIIIWPIIIYALYNNRRKK